MSARSTKCSAKKGGNFLYTGIYTDVSLAWGQHFFLSALYFKLHNLYLILFFFLLLDNEICLNKIKQYYCEFIIIVSPKTIHVFTVNVSPWYRAMVNIMVFNATFNNISIILWRLFVLVEETGVPGENHRPAASHWLTYSHNVASSTPRTHNVSGDR